MRDVGALFQEPLWLFGEWLGSIVVFSELGSLCATETCCNCLYLITLGRKTGKGMF